MTIPEKAAYLKGLMDGLELDTEKAEGKMISAMVELLGDMAKRLTDIEETTIAISDELDEIEEDLDAIEDYILDEEDEDEDEDFDDLCDCDFETFVRTPKPSAYFYRDVIANNGFSQEILRKYLTELHSIGLKK